MMNKDKRLLEYPVELESQLIMRLPDEPARALREALKSGENFKNRLSIQIEEDMRHGEVRFDHWLLHAKIVDLPTIVESLKTIDRKSLYKTADICQMMICKHELDPIMEEEAPAKNKKKDSLKVDKKFLFPHGVTPPTKNVRKRRFRKTLKKKNAEAPEIEKEVKRLLRADNEAISVTWEVIKEDDDVKPETSSSGKSERIRMKKEYSIKTESKVEDIFGEAVSDSDLDENVDVEEMNRLSSYDDHILSDSNSVQGSVDYKGSSYATQFRPDMFHSTSSSNNFPQPTTSSASYQESGLLKRDFHFTADDYLIQPSNDNDDIVLQLQQLTSELEELKQKRQQTQQEILRLENMTLRQRFQNILETLNKEILHKERECLKIQYMLN